MKVLWFQNASFTGDQIGSHIAGGRGGWLSNLAGMIRDDVDLNVACVDSNPSAIIRAGGMSTYFIKPQWRKPRLLLKSLFNLQFATEFTVQQLISIIDDVRPDLIHIHGTEKGFITVLAEKHRIDAPILVSIQGVMNSFERFYPGGYDRAFLSRFWFDHGGRANSMLPKRYIPAWRVAQRQGRRERDFLKYASYIDGRTEYDRSVTRILAPNSKYFHIDRLLRAEFTSDDIGWKGPFKSPNFVHSTMSDSLIKGFVLVAETAMHILRHRPGFRWRIAGINGDSPTVRAARKKLGRDFPESCFDFIGNLNAPKLSATLADTPIFVLASYVENSPNSLAEAQIVGTPCIATDVGGVSTYVSSGTSGILVPPGDPLALAGAIMSLLENPAEASRIGENARQAALHRHNPSKVKEQLLSTYETVCSDYSRRSN